jgi:hypothetical protein
VRERGGEAPQRRVNIKARGDDCWLSAGAALQGFEADHTVASLAQVLRCAGKENGKGDPEVGQVSGGRKIEAGKARPDGMGRNPAFRAETAPEKKNGREGSENSNGRATRAFKGSLMGSKATGAGSKGDAATKAAKEAKKQLVAELKRALGKAPTLAGVLNRHCEEIMIEIPGAGVFTMFNYREGIEQVLSRVKRMSVERKAGYSEVLPTRAQGRKFLREARRLARGKGRGHGR